MNNSDTATSDKCTAANGFGMPVTDKPDPLAPDCPHTFPANVAGNENCENPLSLEEQYQQLISKFSHEIRNPLTLVNSTLPFIEQDFPGLLESDLWKNIKQDIQDVISLVRDMSALNNSGKINRTSFLLGRLLDDVSASFAPLMKKHRIQLSVSMAPALTSKCLFADRLKIKEAVTNLLLNAADAIKETGRPGNISVTADTDGANLYLHVRDNGPGIPDEYLDTLFEPFVTHKPNGTGLGLGIVRNIARQHGGNIFVDTCARPSDSYTDFCLVLPLPVQEH